MRKTLNSLLVFVSGLFGGLLIAECLMIFAARTGGVFGGEVLVVLAIPLLLLAGFVMGRDHR